MEQSKIFELRSRAFRFKRKHRLLEQLSKRTNWSGSQVSLVLKHRADLIRVTRGLHRRNGDPASSHQQFIQTSLLTDGWVEDHLMSALAWSHDMMDDYGDEFTFSHNRRRYSHTMAHSINCMSRAPEWSSLAFRDEVQCSDARLRAGGLRVMVVKVCDRLHNDLNPLRITSEKRRRKSGMKVWQTKNSILPIAKALGYMHDAINWLTDRQQKRLGYTNADLEKLVLRPLDNP